MTLPLGCFNINVRLSTYHVFFQIISDSHVNPFFEREEVVRGVHVEHLLSAIVDGEVDGSTTRDL